MKPRRYPMGRRATDLAPETVDVLLGGWGSPLVDYSSDPHHDPFAIFLADLPGLWRAHRPALMREFARRGGEGLPWGSRFDTGDT